MGTPRLSDVARAADVLVGAGLSLDQHRTGHPILEDLTMNTATMTVPTVPCPAAADELPDLRDMTVLHVEQMHVTVVQSIFSCGHLDQSGDQVVLQREKRHPRPGRDAYPGPAFVLHVDRRRAYSAPMTVKLLLT